MTMEEKYGLMSGVGWDNIPIIHKGPNKEWYYAGNTIPVKRLGIPSFNFADAAGGFRDQWHSDSGTSTCWPSLLSSAASFSPENVEALGAALAEEFSEKGANFILGPSINVHRVARNGRNFEYLSGEDPYLGEILTKAYVEGVQNGGIGCVAKHFVFNQQETNRQTESSVVDNRTAHELCVVFERDARVVRYLSDMIRTQVLSTISRCRGRWSEWNHVFVQSNFRCSELFQ